MTNHKPFENHRRMSSPRYLFLLLLLCTGIAVPAAYAQKEISTTDSVEATSKEGMNAKTDEIYFQFVLPNGYSQSVTFSGRTTS